ncbi:hypothetical protein INR49_031300, partial [Caranx melampygus]
MSAHVAAASKGAKPAGGNMANCVAFQSKVTSIMEKLAKAAVLEISRLWEDGFALVQVELRRRENEIEALNTKLMLMENERLSILLQAQTTNLSSASSSKREQQNKLLPPTGDGPISESAQKLCSDPSVRERADGSVNHTSPPPPPPPPAIQTEEQCEQLKSDYCETDDVDNEDLIVKLEDEDDVQIVEQIVDSDHSAADGVGHHEMDPNQQPAEVLEEQEGEQWTSVLVGEGNTVEDDPDCQNGVGVWPRSEDPVAVVKVSVECLGDLDGAAVVVLPVSLLFQLGGSPVLLVWSFSFLEVAEVRLSGPN